MIETWAFILVVTMTSYYVFYEGVQITAKEPNIKPCEWLASLLTHLFITIPFYLLYLQLYFFRLKK